MSQNIFRVNQRIDVMLSKDPFSERLPSRIEEITPRYMLIAMPVAKGVPVLPPPGCIFYCRVVVDGAVWLCTSTFLDKRPQPLPVWVIAPPHDYRKIQLRSYVRMETALPVEVHIDGADLPPVAATTKDIGGGGVQLITRLALEPGVRLQLAIELAGTGRLTVLGDVVRVEHDAARNLYTAGIKFVEISERERDKIIKYIFKKQLERRQKGLEL